MTMTNTTWHLSEDAAANSVKAGIKAYNEALNDTTKYWFVVTNEPELGYDITFAGINFSDAQKMSAEIELTPGCGYGFLHVEIKRLNWLIWYYGADNLDKVAVELLLGGEARDLYEEMFGKF